MSIRDLNFSTNQQKASRLVTILFLLELFEAVLRLFFLQQNVEILPAFSQLKAPYMRNVLL